MWPERLSNPGPLIYVPGALPTALRGPASLYTLNPYRLAPCKSLCTGQCTRKSLCTGQCTRKSLCTGQCTRKSFCTEQQGGAQSLVTRGVTSYAKKKERSRLTCWITKLGWVYYSGVFTPNFKTRIYVYVHTVFWSC